MKRIKPHILATSFLLFGAALAALIAWEIPNTSAAAIFGLFSVACFGMARVTWEKF